MSRLPLIKIYCYLMIHIRDIILMMVQRRFYQREIDYILSKGYTFELTSDGLWKAVRK